MPSTESKAHPIDDPKFLSNVDDYLDLVRRLHLVRTEREAVSRRLRDLSDEETALASLVNGKGTDVIGILHKIAKDTAQA